MLKAFTAFVRKNKLFLSKDKILLAVSGGVDSIVMASLFQEAGFDFALAHCNFSLRGEESDADEKFVKALARRMGVKCYCKTFDTTIYATLHKCSIQEAARELRYEWFEEVRSKNGFIYIATAHHADDSAETFFINLIRGTGIAGLSGIPLKKGKVIRPLAFASKSGIMEYAGDHELIFREDSSNAGDKYLRNRIRHSLIPLLDELSPAFLSTLNRDMQRLGDAREVLDRLIASEKQNMLEKEGKHYRIRLLALKGKKPLRFYLYELLKEFGFGEVAVNDLAEALEKKSQSGKIFLSKHYKLVLERGYLTIRKLEDEQPLEIFFIPRKKASYKEPFKFRTELISARNFVIPVNPDVACLDASKLSFPLVFRRWKEGDRFYPLGLKGSKLLSDFFTDLKYSSLKKQEAWVLESAGDIVWVAGARIDERYKINPSTATIFKLSKA